MIKQMRLKFFAVISLFSVISVFIFFGAILVGTHLRDRMETQRVLEELVNSFEKFNINLANPTFKVNDPRCLVAKIDNENNIISMPINQHFSDEEINQYVEKILADDYLKNFIFIIKPTNDGKIIAAMDMTIANEAFQILVQRILYLGLGSILIRVTFAWILSAWIVKPAEQSLKKQKRFISEASHELKTPLTIIYAGIELMQKEKTLNQNAKKWLNDIKIQTEKMTAMIADLISLSKLEENPQKADTEFCLSSAIQNTALSFESVAFECKKELICDIVEEVSYEGNQQAVTQAVSILCDNAIKYSSQKAAIKVELKVQKNRPVLQVSNDVENLSCEELPLLFERFYRGSDVRSSTDGTGLGLAILKTIAEQNKWKIDAKLISNNISFIIAF